MASPHRGIRNNLVLFEGGPVKPVKQRFSWGFRKEWQDVCGPGPVHQDTSLLRSSLQPHRVLEGIFSLYIPARALAAVWIMWRWLVPVRAWCQSDLLTWGRLRSRTSPTGTISPDQRRL